MQSIDVVKQATIARTSRVIQLESMFDVAPTEISSNRWQVSFELPESWNVGVIVGPSGAGKTTIAKELFGNISNDRFDWDQNKSVVDSFRHDLSIKTIVQAMSSVGFSSPPSWLRPFQHLSNGEQFRCFIARTLLETDGIAVVDEYTSVVDRTAAQICSAAVQKFVRRENRQFVAVTCHYDVLDWLEPDWVYEPHTNHFYTGRGLHQRPPIDLQILRCERSAWEMFRRHHYLDTELSKAAHCYIATWNGVPVAFSAVMSFPHAINPMWREHRTVCLPDYQGVGIGNAMSEIIASAYSATGKSFFSITSNPAMVMHRAKSANWAMTRTPSRITSKLGKTSTGGWKPSKNRMTASFTWVGQKSKQYAEAFGLI